MEIVQGLLQPFVCVFIKIHGTDLLNTLNFFFFVHVQPALNFSCSTAHYTVGPYLSWDPVVMKGFAPVLRWVL